MQRILPRIGSLVGGIISEDGNTMGLTGEQF